MLLLFNTVVVSVYTMSYHPKKVLFMLKSGLGSPNYILLDPSLLLMPPLCGNKFLDLIMNSTDNVVMRFV